MATAPAAALTRGQKRIRDWTHVKENILMVDDTDPLGRYFDQNGIEDVSKILSYTQATIDAMVYNDGTTDRPVPLGYRTEIRIFQAFYNSCCFAANARIQFVDLTGEAYDDFRAGPYDPEAPISRFGSNLPDNQKEEYYLNKRRMDATNAQIVASRASALASTRSATTNSQASSFKKGIKRSIDDYTIFKNETYWDPWWRSFKATATLHGLDYLFDETYTTPPAPGDDLDLHNLKQKFVYSVLEKKLLTDVGKSLVRKYETTSDGWTIVKLLKEHHQSSEIASIRASQLLTAITTTRWGATRWSGTRTAFIHAWKDRVREYNSIVSAGEQLGDTFLKSLLKNVVSSIPEMATITSLEFIHKSTSTTFTTMSYDDYLTAVLKVATELDIASGSASKMRQMAMNQHQLYLPGDEDRYLDSLEANIAQIEDQYDPQDLDNLFEEMQIQDDGYDELQAMYTNRSNAPQGNPRSPPRSNRPSPYGPSVDAKTFRSLSDDDKRAWDAISPDGRYKIQGSFQGTRGSDSSQTRSPQGTPNRAPQMGQQLGGNAANSNPSNTPSSSTSFGTPPVSPKKSPKAPTPPKPISVNTADMSQTENSQTQVNQSQTLGASQLLVNAAITKENSTQRILPRGNLISLLSSPTPSLPTNSRTANLTPAFPQQCIGQPPSSRGQQQPPDEVVKQKAYACEITYCVTNQETVHSKAALVDRGANGGIAGSDCRLIAPSTIPRRVDIFGIADNELSGVPIGTVGAYVTTNKGPVIAIWHQYALWMKGRSIHSSAQMEQHKLQVGDKSMKVGGLQRIRTPDGYVIPLDVVNGLTLMTMRPYTDDEYDTYPHIIMTADVPDWDPRVLDNVISDKEDWFANIENMELGNLNHPFDEFGNYTKRTPIAHANYSAALRESLHEIRNTESQSFLHELKNLHAEDCVTDDYAQFVTPDPVLFPEVSDIDLTDENTYPLPRRQLFVNRAQRQLSQEKYEELKPCFLYQSKEIVEHTLANTTQYARNILAGPKIWNTIRTPFPAANVLRRHEAVATDTVYSDTAAVDSGGVTAAQFFIGRESKVVDIFPVHTDGEFVNTLQDVIRKRGAMDKLISDSARAEISERVLDILRALVIDNWQSEPYFHHQNYAERGYRDIKGLVNKIMNARGANDDEWLLVLQYVAYIWNRMALQSNSWTPPLQVLTGQTQDISIIYQMPYRTLVYFPRYSDSFPSDTTEDIGYFVGFTENVGHSITFKVLTLDTRKILSRSRVRPAKKFLNRRLPIPDEPKTEDQTPDPDEDNPDGTKPSPKLTVKEYLKSKSGDDDPMPTINVKDLIGRAYLKEYEDTGERHRAEILEIYDQYIADQRDNPDLIKIKVRCNEKEFDDLISYSEVLDFIEDDFQVDDDTFAIRRILDHEGPFTQKDNPDKYKGSSYNVLVEWETLERTWIPLRNVSEFAKAECASYGKAHNLLDKTGWKQFKKLANRMKLMIRQAKQDRAHSVRRAPLFQFGFQVPRDHREAINLDEKNNNTRWRDAEVTELDQINSYDTFIDKGKDASIPAGYKKITVRFVYAVKHDGRHKARLVAGGHLTDTPTTSVYSGVISIRSVKLVAFAAELNGLNLWATDIGNAYLEAYTSEKVCIRAGPEFGALQGHLLIISKALYGLKSSGLAWHNKLMTILRQEGWFPCKADPEVWMRDAGDCYEYIGVYVDDLQLAMREPANFVALLEKKYHLKFKGTGPLSHHLGANFGRDPDGVLYMSAAGYVDRMIESYARTFGRKPKHYVSPMTPGDHPELDITELLDEKGIQIYQSLIGQIQWAVTLGRLDVQTAVMTMSGFRVAPRTGHLLRLHRLIGFLSKFKHAAIRFRVGRPDLSAFEDKEYDWEFTVYGGAREEIPHDAPPARGPVVDTVSYVDANLCHDMLTGRSVTGILHFLNKTPIDSYSKKQNTVETSTYGSEFVASRTAAEQIMDLRTTLRYMGIQLGRSILLGDNESVVNSSSIPSGKLTKRHMALSFHRTREAIAARIFRFFYLPGSANPADILTKHWGYQSIWFSLQPLLFWRGNTADIPLKSSSVHEKGE